MPPVVAGVLMALVLPAWQAGDPAEEVRAVVRLYVDARQISDQAAIRALFTDDADQLTSSGAWRRGPDELVRGMLASSQDNAGTRAIAIRAVRFPAPGVALADGEYTITPPGGAPVRRMWTSFLLVHVEGTWRIAAIRNMLPAADRSGG